MVFSSIDVDNLKREYRCKVAGCSRTESREHWTWYLKERWQRDRKPTVFREIQWHFHELGLEYVYQYLARRLTHRQMFDTARSGLMDEYARVLQDYGVSTVVMDQSYQGMTFEMGLETIKGLKDLVGIRVGDTCPEPVARAAATLWYRYVDLLHARQGLPPVSALGEVIIVTGAYEHEVFASGVFDTFAIRDQQERSQLLALIGVLGA
jgi:hypothetical protein